MLLCFKLEPTLIYSQLCSGSNLVVGRQVIHLVQAFQSYAVFLCYVIHALSRLDGVRAFLVYLLRLGSLLLQVYDVAGMQDVVLVTLVIFGQLPPAKLSLLAYALERVPLSCHKIVVLVVYLYRMQHSSVLCRVVVGGVLGHELVIAAGFVVVV